MTVSNISDNEYQQFKTFLEQSCGILLGEGKQYLVTSRLAKLIRDQQLSSFGELLDHIQRHDKAPLRDAVIDAMTTNETSWFRDQNPFTVLEKEVFPQIEQSTSLQSCRVWSAACSSGQEPYTIGITLNEYLATQARSKLNHLHIMATDISVSMLKEAQQGIYPDTQIDRGLSAARKQTYFKQVDEGWAIKSDIKSRVTFKPQNLLASYAGLGQFDIIFCRNVLIYFSPERKADILKRMAAILSPKGYLFLGASETTLNYSDDFDMVRSPHGVYFQRKD